MDKPPRISSISLVGDEEIHPELARVDCSGKCRDGMEQPTVASEGRVTEARAAPVAAEPKRFNSPLYIE